MSSVVAELEPAFERGRIALRKAESLRDVVEAMADDLPTVVYGSAEEFPPPAPVMEITDEVAEALIRLPGLFGAVQPGVRRRLESDEIRALYDEMCVLKTIGNLIESRREAIKETVRHHMDVDAEERGVAVPKAVIRRGEVVVPATPRDAHGHYILCGPNKPERADIPGTDQAWSREFRNGALVYDTAKIEQLHEDGEIDRRTYLEMTREVRVADEGKILEALRKDPERLSIIRRITSRAVAGTSMFTRKRS